MFVVSWSWSLQYMETRLNFTWLTAAQHNFVPFQPSFILISTIDLCTYIFLSPVHLYLFKYICKCYHQNMWAFYIVLHSLVLLCISIPLFKILVNKTKADQNKGWRTSRISCEDCYARESCLSSAIKYNFCKLDDSGDCIIRKTRPHCV